VVQYCGMAGKETAANGDAAPAKRASKGLGEEHKKALAAGRAEGRAVRRYLEALEATKPRRGRRRTMASVEARLKLVETRLQTADPLSRVHLVQERMNLEGELAQRDSPASLRALEDEFVRAAAGFGRRRGLSHAAWRAAGVSPAVLRRAGIRPSD
jgi:hypothetical protein